MSNPRTHYVTTTDGVTIGGTVHGEGPPLVFLQGAVGDGDLDWNQVVGSLTGRFTCHLPSFRGRGLSGDHPDLRTGRIVEDFSTYVDSIGQPTGLVGWSGGAYFALGVAARRPAAVAAVAAFEPGILTRADEAERAVAGAAIGRAAELAAAGELSAAVRAFLRWPFNDHEIAVAEDAGYIAAAARYVPHLLALIQQAMAKDEAAAIEDPAELATISAPMRVLHGTETGPFFRDCARYVAGHVPDARVRQIPGAGHAAPLTHPQALANALTEFFASAQQPA